MSKQSIETAIAQAAIIANREYSRQMDRILAAVAIDLGREEMRKKCIDLAEESDAFILAKLIREI